MVSQLKKRPELHYAYSLLGNKNINKGEKEINFAKLNKGFYDKLINIDNEIKTSRDSLKTIKTNGIKELYVRTYHLIFSLEFIQIDKYQAHGRTR